MGEKEPSEPLRESLTVVSILLIVVLTTALVGPYFVDWNAHRGEIEHRLSALLGARVAVAGPIDVKLLPRPIFRLQDVSVDAADPAAGTATAARLDMELSLTALLRGEVSFVDADLTSPVVTLPVASDGAIRLPAVADEDASRVSLGHVALRGGSLLLRRPDGTIVSIGGIEGDGEATSLAGPFKFNGTVDSARGPLGIHVATGVVADGHMRLKATLDASGGVPRTDVDGLVTAEAAADGAALRFEGTLVAAGSIPFARTARVIPWRLTGKAHAADGHLALTEGEMRAGADGRALIATVTGDVAGGAAPQAHLSLQARQADAGRLSVPVGQASDDASFTARDDAGSAPTLADDVAALSALGADADLTSSLPFPVTVEAALDTASAGALTLADLRANATLAPGKPVTGRVSAATPDGSRLALDGAFEPGPAAVFKGRLEGATTHLRRIAADLAPDFPRVGAAIRQAVPVDRVTVTAAVDLSGIGFAAHDVALTLDRSSFAGTVTLTRGIGRDHARLFADVTSDALDLDALPDWRDAARATGDLDVSFALVAHALRLAQNDTGSVNAGRIALQIDKVGSVVTLQRLSLADLGGATAEIKGGSDGVTAHAEGHLDARSLGDLMGIVDRLAPGTVTDRLRASAATLSPAVLTIAANARIGPGDLITPTLLTLNGTAAATRIDLSLRPDGTGNAKAADVPGAFGLHLTLDAPDTGTLLRQAGVATAPAPVGRGRLDLQVHRDGTGASQGVLVAALGEVGVTAEGHGTAAGAVSVRATIKGSNAAPLARALKLATPDVGAVWPLDAAGAVTADGRTITVKGMTGHMLGTAFGADLAYALASAMPAATIAPALTGRVTIDRLPLPILAGLVLGPLPAPRPGSLWPDAPFAPALLALPRSEIALSVSTLPLMGSAMATAATATLKLGPATLTLADLAAALGPGRIGGNLTLRRDGALASAAGQVTWSGQPIVSSSLGGTAAVSLDLAGSGVSLAATVASLAGSGSVTIGDARLPRFDPDAIGHVIRGSDAAATTVDETAIAESLATELDRGALSLGAVTDPVTVAAGTMRFPPVRVQKAAIQAEATGSLDLTTLTLSMKTTATATTSPKDWVGAPPQVGVVWTGPFANPARDIDAATLVNGIAARAIARDQTRIQDFQDDIRERAFFAGRLRTIEAEQQAARDKAKAEADAADRQKLQQLLSTLPAADAGAKLPETPRAPMPVRRPPAATPAPSKPLDLH